MPVTVTVVPGSPLVGEKPVTVGTGTVKLLDEQPGVPVPVSTQMGPVAVPAGIVMPSCVAVAVLTGVKLEA